MMDRVRTVSELLFAAGPQGWGYDRLLLVGPLVLLALAVVGRNLATTALAATYVLVFLAAFLYNGVR